MVACSLYFPVVDTDRQPQVAGDLSRGVPGVDAELVEDGGHMVSSGLAGDVQPRAHLGIGEAGREQPEHFELTVGEAGWILDRAAPRPARQPRNPKIP